MSYFQSYETYFWQWEDNADVVAISNSQTIAYRAYINEVIMHLAPQGLPPFGALLATLAATNTNSDVAIGAIHAIVLETLSRSNNPHLGRGIEFLNLLSTLPDEFKTGKKRLLTLQAIFENCHYALSYKDSWRIAQDCKNKQHDAPALLQKKPFDVQVMTKDFRILEILCNRFPSAEAIIEKISGLPEIKLEDLKLENTDDEKDPPDLIEALIENQKTFHVGALIKRIWSGLNIPVHSKLPSDQPIGGISDLTNKGDFDKLLISEFANDDIVFLSRLANNEALFIRREVPPAANQLKRVILIDISIKNWGTPKTIAYAIMLAIAKHPKTNIACDVFLVGEKVYPIQIDKVNDIIDALQILDGCLHCANGLSTYFKEYAGGKNTEVIFLSEPSILKHGEVAKTLSDYQYLFNYWIYSTSKGDVDVYKRQQNSRRHLQHLLLDLQELWQPRKTQNKTETALPGNDNMYPLLLRPTHSTRHLLTTSAGDVFMVTSERQLLRFYERDQSRYLKGWEVVLDDLPYGNAKYEIGLFSDGKYILLAYEPGIHELTLIDLSTKKQTKVGFVHWKKTYLQPFAFHEDEFHHANSAGIWSIDEKGNSRANLRLTHQVFHDRAAALLKEKGVHLPTFNVLKHIKSVYINSKQQLVFGNHALLLNSGQHIKLEKNENHYPILRAKRVRHHQFEFSNGSTVKVHKSGLLILKSADADIPEIFIPACIDNVLGVATAKHFSGNTFYFAEDQYYVEAIDAYENKIGLVKLLKDSLNIGLLASKQAIDQLPGKPIRVTNYVNYEKASIVADQLKNAGVNCKIVLSKEHYLSECQEIMSTTAFFDTYVQPFITNILSHATIH